MTGEYRTATKYWATENYAGTTPDCATCYDDYSGRVSTFDVLANGYIDLGTWYNFTPFIGAGIGAAFNQFSGLTDIGVQTGGYGVAPSSNSVALAWAVHAGVDYSFTPNWKLEVAYRYFNGGKVTSDGIICTAGCTHEVQSFNIALAGCSRRPALCLHRRSGGGPATRHQILIRANRANEKAGREARFFCVAATDRRARKNVISGG